MRCRDAKEWLCAQRDGDLDLAQSEVSALQEHLAQCAECRTFEQQLRSLDKVLSPATPPVPSNILTDNIMLAIQQHKRITQQLEDIRKQQLSRVARLRSVGTAVAAISFFTLSSIPLLLFAVAIIQTDLVVKALAPFNGVIDVMIILAQYLQTGLTLVTRDNWLLSGVAFAVVVMTGMWLRLMRHPQEA